MKSTFLFNFFVLICFSVLFAKEPTIEDINNFNTVYTKDTIFRINGFDDEEFSSQNFTLWDIDEDSPKCNSFQDHYTSLVAFVKANNIRRVVVYPKDPDANPFFVLTSQSISNPKTFAYYVKQLVDLGCEVEIQFDYSNFAASQPFSPIYSYNSEPLPSTNFYFSNLPQKMNWVAGIMKLIPQVRGITIDPEDDNNPQGNTGYQLIINYMDMYRYDPNNNISNLKTGMTFGINVRNFTFANTTTFTYDNTQPTFYQYLVPSCYTAGLQRYPGIPYTDTSVKPPVTYPNEDVSSWRPSPISTAPLLDTVYIQVYEDDMPYIFSLSNDPQLAGLALIDAMNQIPYVPAQGLITTTTNSTAVVGKGTNFTKAMEGLSIGVGSVAAGNVTTLGIINTVTDATHLTLNGPTTTAVSNKPFLQTEIVMKWPFPYTSTTTANRIYLMFSVETVPEDGHSFFGTWTLNQFMTFVKTFYTQGQTQGIYQSPPQGNTDYCDTVNNPSIIPLPNNFAIYTYYKLLQTLWFPQSATCNP